MRFFKYKIHISEEVYLPTKFSQSCPNLPPRFILEKSLEYSHRTHFHGYSSELLRNTSMWLPARAGVGSVPNPEVAVCYLPPGASHTWVAPKCLSYPLVYSALAHSSIVYTE